jgi:hypothetical protein
VNFANFIFFISIFSIQPIIYGCAHTETTINQVAKNPPNTVIHEKTKPIQVKPIVLQLPEGHKLGRIEMGVLCIPMTDLKSIGGKAQVSESDFTDVVRAELENADYNLIDKTPVNSRHAIHEDELVLKGIVTELKANVCFPKSGFRSWKISKGESHVKIYWQIYSKKSDKILFETITEGCERLSEAVGYGSSKVILGSVEVATRNLIADKQFNVAVTNSMN